MNPAASRRTLPGPLLVAIVVFAAVLLTLGRPSTRFAVVEGPGITLDESFNVETGVYLVRSLKAYGLAFLHPATVKEVWGAPVYNPDHPPLGRIALGLSHEWNADPQGPAIQDAAARPASALLFAINVLIVGWVAGRWFGPFAGMMAAVSLGLLPREFAHAHLASLETAIGLTYSAVILFVGDQWGQDESVDFPGAPSPPKKSRLRRFLPELIGGVLLGLALLTKMQAVFLVPAVVLWALWHWRLAAIPRLAVFGGVALVVFFAGWPWLWLDPVTHVRDYFARSTERQTLYCFYDGVRWADRDVPWHYPWVMFGATIPTVFVVLGALGVAGRMRGWGPGWRDPRLQLVLLGIVVPLTVFSLPGIRVYDGERLFNVVYPLWAVVVGRGWGLVWSMLRRIGCLGATAVVLVMLALPVWGPVTYHPCELSWYNSLVGGLAGADRLGFERTYWADGLTESFQRQMVKAVPAGSVIDVAPVLHPFYLEHLLNQSPILKQAGIQLRAYDDKVAGGSPYVLQFHRKADPWASLNPPPPGTEILLELTRADVPLVSLMRLKPAQAR